MTNITYSKVHSTKTEGGVLGMALGGASLVSNSIAGQANEAVSSRRNYKYQTKLNNQGVDNSKKLTDYNMTKQKEMWDATNFEAQKGHLKNAGLNPALMYGMGGGGGTTANVAAGSASGGSANSGGGSKVAPIDIAQLSLLEAQKENIEADTANKKADVPVKQAQVPNIQKDTEVKEVDRLKKGQETFEIGLRTALESFLQTTDEKGNEVGGEFGKSVKAKEAIKGELMKSATLREIAEKIELMGKQGITQDAMTGKLQNEIQLLKNEIDWQAMDIQGDNIGKTIENIIKLLFKGIGVGFSKSIK